MPKKKELLIIFILAVLVTGLSWFWRDYEHTVGGGYIKRGFPLYFWKVSIIRPVVMQPGGGWVEKDYPTIPVWNFKNVTLDFLFWSLVLAGSWWGLNSVLKIRIKNEGFDVKKKVES